MNNKKTIIILILVLFVGIVGLTLAYFANSASVENLFNTQPYGTTVTEEFTSPSNWLPGSEVEKTVVATNTGNVDEAVRISLSENWKTANNGTLNGWITENGNKSSHLEENEPSNDERVAIINFDNASDWTYSNGYYYYNYKLAPNESTSSLIKSVTFNSKTKLDDTCVETPTATGRTITCESSGEDYDNATYTLTFTVETVQYNKYQEAWSTDIAIAEEKQRMLKGLKVNVADATFQNGDKTAMFEFSHPATEQTPALTDYRYIGHMPNNYVKFNCDNDGTNCEIWRIIGVFDVDDGDGNYEQRIKLVRGSAFSSEMEWDMKDYENCTGCGYNEWSTASLNVFLNGDYLNRSGDASTYGLKSLAQSQIENSKYYLGGESSYGTTDDMYSWERGNTVYNQNDEQRSINWNGKVALMYPSDEYMVYAKGVEDECYDNPFKCFYMEAGPSDDGLYNHPETGWIYNSNQLEGQGNYRFIFLLSPFSGKSYQVFSIEKRGLIFAYTNTYVANGIRPVVYLKSSIQITGGDGSEQNPYVLG